MIVLVVHYVMRLSKDTAHSFQCQEVESSVYIRIHTYMYMHELDFIMYACGL